MRYITLEEVIYIYTEIIRRTGGEPGIEEETALEAVLSKPMVTFEGEELYPDVFTKAAVLMFAFINTRPFVEGNKCTAVICTLFILKLNGYHIIAPQESLVELAVGIEKGTYKVDHLITWLRNHATPI
jgi:death on curing protein